MCFDPDSRPPDLPADLVLPRLAGAAGAEILELASADGTRFSAALAGAPGGDEAGVVIVPDVRGLYRFYIELTERFAAAGHPAIAIDPFGRTAGTGERGEDFDYMEHVQQTRVGQVQADIGAAAAVLRERTGARAVVAVGFCFGGFQVFHAASNADLGLAGVVGFYGALGSRRGEPSPAEVAASVAVPVLGLFGGEDHAIPEEEVHAYERALRDAGAEHEIVVYPGAPHSFFDRKAKEFAGESEDAWRRTLGFLERAKTQLRSAT
jgi:carboxymethylenebutenolidase